MAIKKSWKLLAVGFALLIGFLLIAFFVLRERGRADIADGQPRASLNVRSSDFADGASIPTRLTCLGTSLSPSLEFSPLPAGTKSIAIVMDDSDSPFGFVHWLVYNIPGDVHALGEGASSQNKLPLGAKEGSNSADTNGYTGPCPPRKQTHHYVVRIYALNTDVSLPAGITKGDLASVAKGHVLAEGQLTGFYGRTGRKR